MPGAYYVTGVNDKGQIVGNYETQNGNEHGFILYNGILTDIGAFSGNNSNATGINSLGAVVGYSTQADYTGHAFIYRNGEMTDIGAPGDDSIANGINDNGQIVGSSSDSIASSIYYNGTWSDVNKLIDPDSDVLLSGGAAINNNGQIAMMGIHADDSSGDAFLLTPIPEPSALSLCVVGAISMVLIPSYAKSHCRNTGSYRRTWQQWSRDIRS